MALTPSKILGLVGENLAYCYLVLKGYTILFKNYTCQLGEIDLVARHGERLVFIEVKTRSSLAMGVPAEAVTHRKRHQLTKTALYYLNRYGAPDVACRFDVVSVLFGQGALPEIELIEDAF